MIRLCPANGWCCWGGQPAWIFSVTTAINPVVTGQPNILGATFSCLNILPPCAEWIHSLYPFWVCVLRSFIYRSFRTPFLTHTWCAIPPCCSRTVFVMVRFLTTEVWILSLVLRAGFVPKQKKLLLKIQSENQGFCPIKLAAKKTCFRTCCFFYCLTHFRLFQYWIHYRSDTQ